MFKIVTLDSIEMYDRQGSHLSVFVWLDSFSRDRLAKLFEFLGDVSPCVVGFSGEKSEFAHDELDGVMIDRDLPYAITAFFESDLGTDWLEFNDIDCESGSVDEVIAVPIGRDTEAETAMASDIARICKPPR